MKKINDPATIGVTDAGTEMQKADQRAVLVDVLRDHQWVFDNRHFCTCEAEIRYPVPESADRMMAEHQAAEIKRLMPDLLI
jgi:hypothetical protein